METYLKSIYIKNFLSLHDVKLPLNPLTVLVGPNASGKTNILNALSLLRAMMQNEEPPPATLIRNNIWAGGAKSIKIQFEASIDGQKSVYTVELKPKKQERIALEKLTVGKIEVISVKNGKGKVKDEDGSNETDYQSKRLALTSAGDYGYKPITSALNQFMSGWAFYNFNPEMIRGKNIVVDFVSQIGLPIPEELNEEGANLQHILFNWYKNDSSRFQTVNHVFEQYSKFKIDGDKDKKDIIFFEGYVNPIPITRISDGTLRLLAYLSLINQPKLPPLIAIEEPERNLHPAWLSVCSDILNQLSAKTQVIITTHSSQLLDTFTPQSLHENLGVILLHNVLGEGTKAVTLDKMREDREGLQNWIDEFGIGSAIFDSEILQDIMHPSNV